MALVLVVDDEPQILRALTIILRARNYEVTTASCGRQALELAVRRPPDLIVLDLGLPDMAGIDVIHGLRGWTAVPIIVLSGRSGSEDKVTALDAGADDYVTKPFGMDELLARVRVAFRRVPGPPAEPTVTIGRALVDFAAKRVTLAEEPADTAARDGQVPAIAPAVRHLHLTRTEWRLLEPLVRNPGRLLTHRQLLDEVWGPGGYPPENDYLRVYMARLRRKLEPDPSRPHHLITEPGIGYRFQP